MVDLAAGLVDLAAGLAGHPPPAAEPEAKYNDEGEQIFWPKLTDFLEGVKDGSITSSSPHKS